MGLAPCISCVFSSNHTHMIFDIFEAEKRAGSGISISQVVGTGISLLCNGDKSPLHLKGDPS